MRDKRETILQRGIRVASLLVLFMLMGCGGAEPEAATAVPSVPPEPATSEPADPSPTAPAAEVAAAADTAVLQSDTNRAAPLAHLLRFVPATPENARYLLYSDYEAWLNAWQITRPATFNDIQQLDERERTLWIQVMGRQATAPQALIRNITAEEMIDFYGFDFFGSKQYVEAGSPPDEVMAMTHLYQPEAVAQALTAGGYTAETLSNEVTLYSIRADNEIDMEAEMRTGMLGELNRIAISGETLVVGRATAVVTTSIASAAGEQPSLADVAAYQALLRSLDAPELADAGALVGMFLSAEPVVADVADLIFSDNTPEEITEQFEAMVNQDPPLPVYALAGYATYQAEDASYLGLHVVFADAEEAATAVDVLAGRLESYISTRTQEPLPWLVVDAFTHEETAVILMRLDDTDPPVPVSWPALVFSRDTLFLITAE